VSITGISSLASLGSAYDFTSMTNSGLLNAAHSLANQGSISGLDESQLVGIASGVDSAPVGGSGTSVSESLQDPTERNFMGMLNVQLAWDKSTNMTQDTALDQNLVNDLNRYQTDDLADPGRTLSTQV